MITPELIRKLPKTDLHVHLDGSIRLPTLIELARERKVELPSETEAGLRELVYKDRYASLEEYLHGFKYAGSVLQDEEALERGLAPGGVEGPDRRSRFGAFLRRSSLDELPQLLNVLRGEMSVIGPRPERHAYASLFEDRVRRYAERHRVKSGITGWAQVHGLRGRTSLADRVEYDNYYIESWSLWLDVKILLLTVLAVFRSGE